MPKQNIVILKTIIIASLSLVLGSCSEEQQAENTKMQEGKISSAYGSWESPITAELTTRDAVGLASIVMDASDLYWIERRFEGRIIVRRDDEGNITDAIPKGYSSQTRVHEYGGGSYVVHQGTVYFSNQKDQLLYKYEKGGVPVALTQAGARYADCIMGLQERRLICVEENHRKEGEPVNSLVSVSLREGNEITTLFKGTDFISSPVLNKEGNKIAFITWDHPNMWWDDTKLVTANIANDGSLHGVKNIVSGKKLSVLEPRWAQDGTLYYLGDPDNWWNFQSYKEGLSKPLHKTSLEFGVSGSLGMNSYAFIGGNQVITRYKSEGFSHLAKLNLSTGKVTKLKSPYVNISKVYSDGDKVYIMGSTAHESRVIAEYTDGVFTVIKQSQAALVKADYISIPKAIKYKNAQGQDVHAFYYPPKSPKYEGLKGEKPPLIVKLHGGPVSATSSSFNMGIQFWTSRGFALVDINYGGSTGYGRAYRERLRGQWGISDINDTIAGVEYLVDRGLADKKRLLIRGGSAGGYTVLVALARHDVFAAGANYFGISDLEVLAKDTHKYESRFLDSLIGEYPKDIEIYKERSPINHLEGFTKPLIVFQGLADPVVPPNQSEMIVDALRKKNVPVAYYTYEGEAHGFRQKKNIIHSLEAELTFYGRILGFKPAGNLPDIKIENFR
jgi:dipeptidyl aminopeptidase/acylaminoacyl peptidase